MRKGFNGLSGLVREHLKHDVYPNPSNTEDINLELTTTAPVFVTIRLDNMFGDNLYLESFDLPAGTTIMEDFEDLTLPTGIYTSTVTYFIGGEVVIDQRQFVVIR